MPPARACSLVQPAKIPSFHTSWAPYKESERPELCLRAQMPKGSVLIITGGTLHSRGLNTARDPASPSSIRKSIITGYMVGFLRTENRFWGYRPLVEKVLKG